MNQNFKNMNTGKCFESLDLRKVKKNEIYQANLKEQEIHITTL